MDAPVRPNFDAYVGIPFVSGGRDRSGADCWGLLRLVYAERLGVELPSYSDRYEDAADAEAVAQLIRGGLGPWRTVPPGSELPYDGILLREGSHASHVALVVRAGWMLHSSEETGRAVVERYRTSLVRELVVGFYRHG